MHVDFIADYTVRINVPDQEGLTEEEFRNMAIKLAELFQIVITSVNGPPPDGYIDVSLNSLAINGKSLLNGESNA